MYIDLHCHLDLLDADAAVRNAEKAGVSVIMAAGLSPSTNRKVLELQARHRIVRAALGLYPIDAFCTETGNRQSLPGPELECIAGKDMAALGEIGMDLKTGKDEAGQADLFKEQLRLAEKLGKPVIVHSRKAEAKVIDILSRFRAKVVMHCFSGKKKLLHAAIDKGYCFTIPTSVVRSEQFMYMAQAVPLKQLFCETDSPYLSPFRDRSNEPAFVVEAYRKVAELRGMDMKELSNIVYNNYQRLFL